MTVAQDERTGHELHLMRSPAPRPAKRWRRWTVRVVLTLLGALGVFVIALVADGWEAFGRSASGPRLVRMERSTQFRDGQFHNAEPLWNDGWGMVTGLFDKSAYAAPTDPIPVSRDTAWLDAPPSSGLRVTWLGHSTLLIEIDGHRVLTDPVWGPRSSPVSWIGPARWYAPPIPLDDIGRLDAVVISHDHYDHLDHPTIVAMKGWDTLFVVPLGVGVHLAYWGVPEERIVECDWWDRAAVRDLEIVCTPARHASGRVLFDKDATLWAGYALLGPTHRAYFSGDTGLFPAMKDIGDRLGPFDVTMIEAGAYGASWPDWHLGPEQAVLAHQLVRGRVLLPVHWGLFDLAYHAWTAPAERVLAAGAEAGIAVAVPRPGAPIEPSAPVPGERWWPDLPIADAARDPIVATAIDPILLRGLRPVLPRRADGR